jgi:hypothetical protein
VLIIGGAAVFTIRMRWLNVSAMKILLLPSTHTAPGLSSMADVAVVAASPLNPSMPFPATVVTAPAETLRITWFRVSAMYTSPVDVTNTPFG